MSSNDEPGNSRSKTLQQAAPAYLKPEETARQLNEDATPGQDISPDAATPSF